MKTTKYLLIALFIPGILATGFSQKSFITQKFNLQSTDIKLSTAELKRSAEIITGRLKSFSTEKSAVITFPEKNQIQVVLTGNWDSKLTESLITQKGRLEFYETYNYKQVMTLLKNDGSLPALLHDQAPGDSSAKLGCTSSAELNNVITYLNSTGLNLKCKFAGSNLFQDSSVCLYALRLNSGNGVLLRGSDIERFNIKYEPLLNKDSFEFKFKTSVIGKWAEITRRNLNNAIAIVMDDNVIYAPVVKSEISGGNCQVTGDFTSMQLRYIVAIGANGELPAVFFNVK